jgi:hypothetical protein
MASWRKRLARMVADPDPRSYRYKEAASILARLGFELAKPTDGSHRKWRRGIPDPTHPKGRRIVVIGLVESGRGTMKPEYVKDMVEILRANDLLPDGV